jgi:YihY family inner membrane protein
VSANDWTEHTRVLGLRRRSAAANALVIAMGNYKRHRTGRQAALLAHYGFLSVFPLMLVFTTVLGLVLDGRPKLRDEIIDTVFSHLPIIGPQIALDPSALSGSWAVLVIGLLTALWAALKAFNVLQTALDDIAEVPTGVRPNMVRTRLRSLVGIAVIGGAQIGAAVLAILVSATGLEWVSRVLLTLATVALNIAALAGTYRWLCSKPPVLRGSLPGAISGGIVFTGLQYMGTTVVARAIARASPVYGTFATVIGLISWLGLHAMVALLGAEVNAVLPMRRLERTEIDALTPRP